MIKFDSYETEKYYFNEVRKLGIFHVNISSEHIYSKEDVDNLVIELARQVKELGL
ncbi:hypothetical protein lbkm_0641 [Lachnospiraceae bacterium KM106-2]|nr:hypothetical protein lbkm_0641 [Lachnospiraceae bacterium KM106-2]